MSADQETGYPGSPESKKSNPFPRPTPLESSHLRELCRVARFCYERGWSYGTAGNFSLRGTAGLIWQSPTGWNKGDLDPQGFVPVDLITSGPVMPASPKPSGEMAVHIGIYRNVSKAQCVVHAHPPYLVAASRNQQALKFRGEEMQKHLGAKDHNDAVEIPVAENPTPEQMPEVANSLGRWLHPGVPMIALAAHGVYAWGRTPMEALSYLEAAEFLCRTS